MPTPLRDTRLVDRMKAHLQYFVLWPDAWNSYNEAHEWEIMHLVDANRAEVPVESGIYTLILEPGIGNHIACSYLFYVGKTNNLRRRFREYLTSERYKRTMISDFLSRYDTYIHFCYTYVDEDDLTDVENNIRNAYVPPLNEEYEAEVYQTVGAFP